MQTEPVNIFTTELENGQGLNMVVCTVEGLNDESTAVDLASFLQEQAMAWVAKKLFDEGGVTIVDLGRDEVPPPEGLH